MTEFVINEETARLPIGELLRRAERDDVQLLNASRQTIGWIGPAPEPIPPLSPEELDEIRRRSRSDLSNGLTVTELLARLHARTADE